MSSKSRDQKGRKHKKCFRRQQNNDRKQARSGPPAVFRARVTVEERLRRDESVESCSVAECCAPGVLALACALKRWKQAALIVRRGADVNAGDPFTNVLRAGPETLRELFLERGVEITEQHRVIDERLRTS
jgi:hypothetical protein